MKRHLTPSFRLLSSVLLVTILTGSSVQGQDQTVRVRVLERFNPSIISIQAIGGPVQVFGSEPRTPLATLATGRSAKVRSDGGTILVTLPSSDVRAQQILLVPSTKSGVQVEVEQSRPLKEPRLYRGQLTLKPERTKTTILRIINTVDLEEYVASVLPQEYPFDDVEGAKAMAIVIRTYALRSTDKYGPDYDHVDHTGSQVYEGSANVTNLAVEAAQATKGIVLSYHGRPIEATYYASSGGYTANNEDVWQSSALPYLRAKADPYDVAPDHKWTSTLSRVQVIGVLTAAYGGGKRVVDFDPVSYGKDGRARFIRITLSDRSEVKVQSNRFRMVIIRHFGATSLRSTMFSVSRTKESYVLTGSGYGHGVGLSQWGAHEMARRGKSFRDILSFYYTGVNLKESGTLDLASEGNVSRTGVDMAGARPNASDLANDHPRAGW